MNINNIIEILKEKFSKKKFFVRIYHIKDEIVIYNDSKIVLRYII